jgi:hypothetical protein
VTDERARSEAEEVGLRSSGQSPEEAALSEVALRSEGQRTISRVWEDTQMRLALLTVGGFMFAQSAVVMLVAIALVWNWASLAENPTAIAVLIAVLSGSLGAIGSLASLVIGFYFGRTNHQRVGGPGGDSAGWR